MAFAQGEDLTGHAEIIIFPRLFATVENLLDSYHVFVIKGFLDITSQTKCKIKANEMIPVEQVFENRTLIQALTLQLPALVNNEQLIKVRNQLPAGSTPLRLAFVENSNNLLLQSSKQIGATMDILHELEKEGIKISLTI